MTQVELAEKYGLQNSYLAGIERGNMNITIQTLEKITGGLDEVPNSIFKFDNGAKPYVEADNLTLGEPPLLIRNDLVHSPNGEVIEFIQDVDFDIESHSSMQ